MLPTDRANDDLRPVIPTQSDIRDTTLGAFGVRPCLWQIKVAEAILTGDKDIICMAGTGMGMTLTFWIPLLFQTNGIQVVVTPPDLLGQQHVEFLANAGIKAIAIGVESATTRRSNLQAIAQFHYRVVVISPEELMKSTSEFAKLLKTPAFVSRIISIIMDEAHCFTEWGDFRPEYQELGWLRYVLPATVPLYIASAPLTKSTLSDISQLLHLQQDKLITMQCSSDRPNIRIGVRKIKYAQKSFADLAFLIPDGFKEGDPPPPKFLIFFDDITESINATKSLWKRLPRNLIHKIKWFNVDMSTTYKVTEMKNLANGDTWGLCTTSSFGMDFDIPDIQLVIQWRATCDLSMLWHRFGHTAGNKTLTGTAILFAEKDYFDEERAVKVAREKKREEARKRKAGSSISPASSCLAKRTAISGSNRPGKAPEADVTSTVQDIASCDDREAEGESSEGESDGESGIVENAQQVEGSTRTPALGVESLLDMLSKAERERRLGSRCNKRPVRKSEVEPGIDYLINAESRGLGCRRKVFDLCLDDGIAGGAADHQQCNMEEPEGCQRCHVKLLPSICCDIHQPSEFDIYDSEVYEPPPPPKPSRIPKYTKDEHDFQLIDSLCDWREAKTIEVYGWARLHDFGSSLVMPNSILDRIVDCAHHRKISTTQDLQRETRWSGVEKFGKEVIEIIVRHTASLPLAVSTPFILNTTNDNAPVTPSTNPGSPQLT